MPESAVEFIAKLVHAVLFFTATERSDKGDHLIMAKTMFKNELVVADAGVALPCFDDAVKNILSVLSLVQGQIILFQFLR